MWRRDGSRSELLAHVLGSPNELPELLFVHKASEGAAAVNVLLRQQLVYGLDGAEFAWVLNARLSAEGNLEESCQVLWADNLTHELMSVERSGNGEIVSIEKTLCSGDDREFTITYGGDCEVIDIFEHRYDSEDYYFEDLVPMLDDLEFFSNGCALPSCLGPDAQIPELPAPLVRKAAMGVVG